MSVRQHTAIGSHVCVQCDLPYACAAIHETAGEAMMDGKRCCEGCKAWNVRVLARLEERRRRRLYV